jgi:hypothetical protein
VVVVGVKDWLLAGTPFASKLPECRTVLPAQGEPFGAAATLTVAADLTAASGRPTIAVTVTAVGRADTSKTLFGLIPETHPVEYSVAAPTLVPTVLKMPEAQVMVVPSHFAAPKALLLATGRSAGAKARGATGPAAPLGEASTWFAGSDVPVNERVPEVVTGEPPTVK